MRADSVDETNIREWTPIGESPASSAARSVSSAPPVLVSAERQGETATASNAVGPIPSAEPTVLSTDRHPGSGACGESSVPTPGELRSTNGPTPWHPATGPQGHGTHDEAPSTHGRANNRVNGGLNQWLPANQPGVLPVFPTAAPTAPTAAAMAAGESTKTDEVRHGGPFSTKAWRWSIAAVVAILGIIVLVEIGLSRLIDSYESGTTQRLALACASLFTNDVVIIGVLIVVLKRMGMSFRSLGIRRPADVKESIVLAFAGWLIFILLAGVWALVSQSTAEREANNPLLRDKTVNAQDSSATESPDSASDARSGATSSADADGTNSELGTGKTTSTRTEQSAQSTESAESENNDVADNRHVLIKVLNDDPPKALLLSILITGCIGAPLLEELLVRGLLFGAFSQRFGKLAGGAISSLLFGFAHIMAYPIKMIPPLVLMGVVLAWLAWQTGSIVPGIFIHAFVNSIGLGIAASLGGHIFTLMIGSWLALGIILLPWLRSKSLTGLAGS